MDKLALIIGPAPSELPFDQLLVRLSVERNRTREAIARYRAQPAGKVSKPTKKKRNAEMSKLLVETGLTPEELSALIKESKA